MHKNRKSKQGHSHTETPKGNVKVSNSNVRVLLLHNVIDIKLVS